MAPHIKHPLYHFPTVKTVAISRKVVTAPVPLAHPYFKCFVHYFTSADNVVTMTCWRATFWWVNFLNFRLEWCSRLLPLPSLTIKRGSGDTTKHLLNALTVNESRLNADCCLHAFLQAKKNALTLEGKMGDNVAVHSHPIASS